MVLFLYPNLNGGKFMNENIISMKAVIDNILSLMITGIFCCAIIIMICGLITSLYYFFIKHKGLKKSCKPMLRTLTDGLTIILIANALAFFSDCEPIFYENGKQSIPMFIIWTLGCMTVIQGVKWLGKKNNEPIMPYDTEKKDVLSKDENLVEQENEI